MRRHYSKHFLLSLFFLGILIFQSGCQPKSNSDSKGSGSVDPAAISGFGESCDNFIKNIPQSYYYGWLDVPENYENPNSSPMIKVFYYGPKGDFAEHVAFYNGGPGSDSHYNFKLFDKSFQNFNLSQDKVGFVYIDQRGNGCSSPYPNVDTTNNEQMNADILRLRYYGSTGIVHDSEAIRKHLFGDKKWKIFGQSYGAFIVHRYVTLFPDSVLSAYAHANAINSNALERLTERIYSQYRVMEMYLQIYPQDRNRIYALSSLLENKNLCFDDKINKSDFCGKEVLQLLISYLGFSNNWSKLNSLLIQFVPDGSSLSSSVEKAAIQKFIDDTSDLEPNYAGYNFAMTVISYYDRNIINSNYDNCKLVYQKISEKYHVDSNKILISECLSGIQFQIQSKKYDRIVSLFQSSGINNDHLTLENFKNSLLKLKPEQFHLYSGERDTYVPKANFTEELTSLGSLLTYTHFPNTGHEGFFKERKVLEDLLQ